MRGPHFHGVGGVLSADIAVPSRERELEFYSRVLTTGTAPLWRDDLANSRGAPVIGLGAASPEYASLPLQWMPHFQVADVAMSAARAQELGGRELMHGKDDAGRSQWAVLVDPAGAAFGVIPVVADEPAARGRDHATGSIAWLSLVAADVPAASDFYERVVGLPTASAATEGHRELRRPDGDAAGEIRAVDDRNEGLAAAWLLALPVADLAESLRRVREAGGTVVGEVLGPGRTVIRDPVGVCLALQACE